MGYIIWKRDDRYNGMTKEEAWEDYHERHPEVLADWGEQNDRMPNDNIIAIEVEDGE